MPSQNSAWSLLSGLAARILIGPPRMYKQFPLTYNGLTVGVTRSRNMTLSMGEIMAKGVNMSWGVTMSMKWTMS